MKYKTTYLSSIMAGLLLTACSRSVPTAVLAARPTCSLLESPSPVKLELKSIRPILDDFKNSKFYYDALWVKIRGGQLTQYRRIQLIDQNVWFCDGEEGSVPKYEHRSGFPAIEKLFNQLHSGNYMGGPTPLYSTEPELEFLHVKKSGVSVCSYAIDRDCRDNLANEEQVKIADALKLAFYMQKL